MKAFHLLLMDSSLFMSFRPAFPTGACAVLIISICVSIFAAPGLAQTIEVGSDRVVPPGNAESGGMPIDIQVFLAPSAENPDRPPTQGCTADVVATLSWAGTGKKPRVREVPSLMPKMVELFESDGRTRGDAGPGTRTGSRSVEVERVGVTARTVYSAGRPIWSQSFTYHLRLGGAGRVSIPSLEFRCEVNGTEETVTSPPLEFEVVPAPGPGYFEGVLRNPFLPLIVGVFALAIVGVKIFRKRREKAEQVERITEDQASRQRQDLANHLAGVTAAARKVTAGDDTGAVRDLGRILDGVLEDSLGIQARGLNRDELQQALDKIPLHGEMIALAAEIHEAAANLRYGGMCPERERILRLFSRAPALIRCLCDGGPAVTFECPTCGAPVNGNDNNCPTCGEEFEQIRKESR